MLEAILAEQRRMSAQINRKLDALSNQVVGLWTEMNDWFALTLGTIAGMMDTLGEIQDQLAVIEELLHEVLAELDELQDRVDWNAVIGMFAEHEHRVGYCVESMMEITVQPVGPREPDAASRDGGPLLRVDTGELDEWALAATDAGSGLGYCLHRVITGETILNRSLMDAFCALMKHKTLIGYQDAARYFLKLAAVQAQGFGTLAKARQAANLPEIDYAGLLEQRFYAQSAAVNEVLEVHYQATQWNDALHRDGLLESKIPWGASGEKATAYFLVSDNRQVIAGMGVPYALGTPHRTWTEFYVGQAKPGSRQIEAGSVKTLTTFTDGKEKILSTFMAPVQEVSPATGLQHRYYSYYAQPFVFDSNYVMVGLKVSCPNNAFLCEPLLAEFDEETGTTSWNGSSGSLWKATLADFCQPTTLDLGPTSAQNAPWHDGLWTQFPPTGYTFPSQQVPSGFRINLRLSRERMWLRAGFLDPTWPQRTLLPACPVPDYQIIEPFQLP